MRIIETVDRLEVRDVPGVLWILGIVFVASGSFVLSAPFWAPEWRDFGKWERLGMVALGVAHLAGGLVTAGQARATVTSFDRAEGRGLQRVGRLWSFGKGALAATRAEFSLADVRAVEIVRTKDSDGDAVFRLRLWLARSESLWLQAQPVLGEARVSEQAERLRRFLRLDGAVLPPVPGVER